MQTPCDKERNWKPLAVMQNPCLSCSLHVKTEVTYHQYLFRYLIWNIVKMGRYSYCFYQGVFAIHACILWIGLFINNITSSTPSLGNCIMTTFISLRNFSHFDWKYQFNMLNCIMAISIKLHGHFTDRVPMYRRLLMSSTYTTVVW